MREQAQTVGAWEEKRGLMSYQRYTDWWPDNEIFVAKQFVTPDQMAERYKFAADALTRPGYSRPRSIEDQLKDGAEQAAKDNAARPSPTKNKDKPDR